MTPPKEKEPDCLDIVGKVKAGKQHCCHKSCPPKRTKKIQSTSTTENRERNHRLCQKISVETVFTKCCVVSAPLFIPINKTVLCCTYLHISLLINSV